MKKLTTYTLGFAMMTGMFLVAQADIKEDTGHESFATSVLTCSNSTVYHDNWCAKLIKCGAEIERKPIKEIKKDKENAACKLCFKE